MRLENGETNVTIAKELGCSHSTISTMRKNKEKIRSSFNNFEDLNKKKDRKANFADVDNALLEWFKFQRNNITSLLVVPYCKARLMNLQNCLDILTLIAQKVGF